MKTLGIIGGIAPASTVLYYNSIIRHFRAQTADGSYPSILINSIDLQKLLRLVESKELDALADYLSQEIDKLAVGGAELALLASNTPHIIFDQLQKRSRIPLVSITKAAAEGAARLGLRRLGLFGTRFIMEADAYPKALAARGMSVIAPSPAEQRYIHEKYMAELSEGGESAVLHDLFIKIASDQKQRDNIDGVILGGCELSVLFPAGAKGPTPVPFLDMVDLHSAATVSQLIAASR